MQLLSTFLCLLTFGSALAAGPGGSGFGKQPSHPVARQYVAAASDTPSADAMPPAGVGLLLISDKAGFVVQYVLPDMPAANANVQVGDVILSVDGVSADKFKSVDEVVGKIRGDAGSAVKLKIQSGGKTREITLIRGAIPSVKPLKTDNFGREVAVYFYQFEDLVPESDSGTCLFLNHDYSVGAFLRSQLRRNRIH
jgi:membrane-associated protease RseP (regulator of RpoE activity)